jgi:hypothetical protein
VLTAVLDLLQAAHGCGLWPQVAITRARSPFYSELYSLHTQRAWTRLLHGSKSTTAILAGTLHAVQRLSNLPQIVGRTSAAD